MSLAPLLLAVRCDEPTDEARLPAPDAPTSVRSELVSTPAALRLSWTDASAGEAGFVVARARVASAGARATTADLDVIGSVGADVTSFTDDSADVGRFYVYAVAAYGAGGRSAFVFQSGDALRLDGTTGGVCGGPATATDLDGDGLEDAVEDAGWLVTVDENGQGQTSQRRVASNPARGDSDGDGLCDAEERAARTDPLSPDTDGDGLLDQEELERWGSSPIDVDSDGDANGNGLFYDGAELGSLGTSPTLADTDGDGRSDFVEVNQNGTNALVADLPRAALTMVGRADVDLVVERSDGSSVTLDDVSSLEQSTTTNLAQSSSVAVQSSTELSVTTQARASLGTDGGGVEASVAVGWTEGYVEERATTLTRESVEGAQQALETATTFASEQNATITGGTLAVGFELENLGTRTFRIENVVVTALRPSPTDRSRFVPITTLTLPDVAGGSVLGAGARRGPFRAEGTLTATQALDLLANPSGVVFRVASFQLVDESDANFQFTVGESTHARTALLTFDYGGRRPLERHRVATNVERSPDGRPAGVSLGDVLVSVLGIPEGPTGYTTRTLSSGVQVLDGMRGITTERDGAGRLVGYWVLHATPNDSAPLPLATRVLGGTVDLEDMRLFAQDELYFVYVRDLDADGLYESEEKLFGSSDSDPDSDDDGLDDAEEVRTGWTVAVDRAPYRTNPVVYASPVSRDLDRDGLDDATERMRGTDPNRRDTDGDGRPDDTDPAPTTGPSGSWVEAVATEGQERLLGFVVNGSTAYVYGDSTGDVDGDGTSGGAFLVGLDTTTGSTVFVHQFESAVAAARGLVRDALGGAWLALRYDVLGPNPDLGGAVPPGVNVLRFDATGAVVEVLPLDEYYYAGWYPSPDVVPTYVAEGPQGGLVFGYWDPSNPNTVIGWRADRSKRAPPSLPLGMVSVASRGSIYAWLNDDAFTCGTHLYGGDFTPVATMPCAGATVVGLDALGGYLFGGADGAGAYLRRTNIAAATIYRVDLPLAGGIEAEVGDLVVDDADQVAVVYRYPQSVEPSVIAGYDVDGSATYSVAVGNPSTNLTALRKNTVGDLFAAGTSRGGFEPHASAAGGDDVVIVRNPNLLFAP